jgi:hypothetical protein
MHRAGGPPSSNAITSVTANQCGTSSMHYTLCPSSGHQETDANGNNVWTNAVMNDFAFNISAASPPTMSAPATLSATINVSTAVSGVAATDAANPSDTMSFTGTSTGNGKLSATGATGNGTGAITFSGTLSALNTLLGTIHFIDASSDNPTLNFSMTDQHSLSASASTLVTIAAAAPATMTAPAIAAAAHAQPVTTTVPTTLQNTQCTTSQFLLGAAAGNAPTCQALTLSLFPSIAANTTLGATSAGSSLDAEAGPRLN